jgi:hypothetical protein
VRRKMAAIGNRGVKTCHLINRRKRRVLKMGGGVDWKNVGTFGHCEILFQRNRQRNVYANSEICIRRRIFIIKQDFH